MALSSNNSLSLSHFSDYNFLKLNAYLCVHQYFRDRFPCTEINPMSETSGLTTLLSLSIRVIKVTSVDVFISMFGNFCMHKIIREAWISGALDLP